MRYFFFVFVLWGLLAGLQVEGGGRIRKLLRVEQLAEMLNISVPMAYRILESPDRFNLYPIRIGRSLRVCEEDVIKWIEEQKEASKPEAVDFDLMRIGRR